MAIQKTKTLANGMTGNYWKITSVSVDKQSMKLKVTMALFVAQANTATSPIPTTNKLFTFTVTKVDLMGDLVALCYASIKAKNDPDLTGGTDV